MTTCMHILIYICKYKYIYIYFSIYFFIFFIFVYSFIFIYIYIHIHIYSKKSRLCDNTTLSISAVTLPLVPRAPALAWSWLRLPSFFVLWGLGAGPHHHCFCFTRSSIWDKDETSSTWLNWYALAIDILSHPLYVCRALCNPTLCSSSLRWIRTPVGRGGRGGGEH